MNLPTPTTDVWGYVDYDKIDYDNMSVVYHTIKDQERHHIVTTYSKTTHLINIYVDNMHMIEFGCDMSSFHQELHDIHSLADHVIGLYIYNRILPEEDIKFLCKEMESNK